MEKRIITFDEGLHKYSDEYGKVYTSVTQLIHKVAPTYDTEFWAMYRALDQAGYKPRPFPEVRVIEVLYNGKRQRFELSSLLNGILPVNKEHSDFMSADLYSIVVP